MSSFNKHIPEMYIAYIFSIYIYIYLFIYIYTYLCIAYISSHSKGPEQEQLRSPFVPYVRNTAERSIHNLTRHQFAHPLLLAGLQSKRLQCCFGYEGLRLHPHAQSRLANPHRWAFQFSSLPATKQTGV